MSVYLEDKVNYKRMLAAHDMLKDCVFEPAELQRSCPRLERQIEEAVVLAAKFLQYAYKVQQSIKDDAAPASGQQEKT